MSKYMSMDNLKYLLFDVHKISDLLEYDRFADYDEDSFNILLDSAKAWADRDFYPFFKEMDEKPAVYRNGKVHSHPILNKIFKEAGDKGWLGSYFNYDDGGMQMPHSLANAVNHIIESANNHIPGYLGLTSGAAHLIATFGDDHLKKQFIPNMLKGEWGGTMAMTEPQSGSSLADLLTSAQSTDQGHFKIKGQKIFISGGDHEAVSNFIHLTLARIEGSPKGTKGISLFVVPKLRKGEGALLEDNDVKVVADFQKMGQRGYSTVHLVFGEEDDCRGYLVGEPDKGLQYMFQMMNGARIDVGMTAASTATAAYYASLQYAGERSQGRKILKSGEKDLSDNQTLIINHSDVQRMLLLQKSIIEGSLSLLIECSKLTDVSHCSVGNTKENSLLLLEFLTPIAKTYPAEMGRESINNGLQILGGYGFCMDFPLQQYLRDIRIMAIYEGTTGIQSLDLLSRKILLQDGKAMKLLTEAINFSINEAKTHVELISYAETIQGKMNEINTAIEYLMSYYIKGDYENYLADATIFMEMLSKVIIGHQWLKIATNAVNNIKTKSGSYDLAFYESKIHTMKFYYKYELPKTKACLETLVHSDKLTIIKDDKYLIF